MTPNRLFRDVLVGTLCIDLFSDMVLGSVPGAGIHLLGRVLVCLAAGYAGAPALGLARSWFLVPGTSLVATVITTFVYLATGVGFTERFGPPHALAFVVMSVIIGVIAAPLGAGAAALRRRWSQRPAAG
jgi:hypothetical protein